MVPGPFSLIFDHEQSRVQQNPLFVTIKGLLWNGGIFEDAWIDPIMHTLMLRPMCKYGGVWGTSNSGIFARPTISAYEFENSGYWVAKEQIVGAGEFMGTLEATAPIGYVRTATAPGLNRGVNVAFFKYNAGEQGILGYFGWDDTDTTYDGSAIGGIVYADGTITIYKAGAIVAEGKIGIPMSQNVPVEFMLLPMRTRELLILGATDQGFRVVFDDIEEDDSSPEIVPAEKFWFKPVATATKCEVQITPLAFEETGYANSVVASFPKPPASGATATVWANPVFTGITSANVYGVTAFAGTTDVTSVELVETDGSTAFVADGLLNSARLKITMEGDGSYTPFIYGAVFAFDGETGLTNDTEEADLDDYILELVIEQGDDPWGMHVSVVIKEPDAGESTVAKLKTIGKRPGKLECDGLVLVDGRYGEPRYVDGLTDELKSVALSLMPITAQLRAYQFRDEFPFDGYLLSDSTGDCAIRTIALMAGLSDSQLLLSDETFTLPEIGGETCEEFNISIPPGDDGQQAIEALHSKFAADWFIGMRWTASGPKFAFLHPDDLDDTPVMTVYREVADAVGAGAPDTAVYSELEQETEEVAANEIIVIGQDPRTKEVVQVYAIDEAAQDCTTAPSLRPDNWSGEPDLYVVKDNRLRRQSDCERLVAALVPIVMAKRTLGEFYCPEMLWYNSDPGGTDVMLPVQRGDTVTLDGYGDVLITGLSVHIVMNVDGSMVTNARYTFGGFTNAGGTSLAEIQQRNKARYSLSLLDALTRSQLPVAVKIRRSEAP